jgi:hypothetical protein
MLIKHIYFSTILIPSAPSAEFDFRAASTRIVEKTPVAVALLAFPMTNLQLFRRIRQFSR